MVHTTELLCLYGLKSFCRKLVLLLSIDKPIAMYCNNQAANHTVYNPMFHETTKHIRGGSRFIIMTDEFVDNKIVTPYIRSRIQLVIFSQSPCKTRVFPSISGSVEDNFLFRSSCTKVVK